MCLAAEKDGRFDVIANDTGDFVTPTIYGLLDGESLVGLSAKQLRGRKPASVAVDSKGKIGSNDLSDFSIEDDGKEKKVSVEKVHTQFYKDMKKLLVILRVRMI
jgi:molecular chaperone DnaK (HSP70)